MNFALGRSKKAQQQQHHPDNNKETSGDKLKKQMFCHVANQTN